MLHIIMLFQDPPAGDPSPLSALTGMMPMLLIMFVIIYFLLIRPQNKQRRAVETMLANLAKNDQVVTQGGIHATIASIEKDGPTVTLKIAENIRIKVSRSAITNKITPGDDEK